MVQPPSNSAERTDQTVFQSTLGGPSSVTWLSAKPPIELA